MTYSQLPPLVLEALGVEAVSRAKQSALDGPRRSSRGRPRHRPQPPQGVLGPVRRARGGSWPATHLDELCRRDHPARQPDARLPQPLPDVRGLVPATVPAPLLRVVLRVQQPRDVGPELEHLERDGVQEG